MKTDAKLVVKRQSKAHMKTVDISVTDKSGGSINSYGCKCSSDQFYN